MPPSRARSSRTFPCRRGSSSGPTCSSPTPTSAAPSDRADFSTRARRIPPARPPTSAIGFPSMAGPRPPIRRREERASSSSARVAPSSGAICDAPRGLARISPCSSSRSNPSWSARRKARDPERQLHDPPKMSILHTLEDFDSRVEKARANLLRWFVLAAVVAVAAVVVSWSVRQFVSRKSESKWIPFDTQLNVRGGFLGFPMVTATHDPDIAASEVRATAGQSWGEIARAAQAGRAGEVGRLTDSLSNLQGASGTDPAIRTLSTFLQSDGTAGLEGQISRAEALRGWLDSHQNLSANLTQEGSPGLELELDGGRLVFRFDPKLPPSSVESILGFVKSDAFANAALVWNTTERC